MVNSPEEDIIAAFETIIRQQLKREDLDQLINYNIAHPKHLFLRYLVEEKGMYLHGSNIKDLKALTPKKATGTVTGQAETAVYATMNVIMAIFFAIIDRSKVPFFATRVHPDRIFVARAALDQAPWVEGMVYLFGPDSFESKAGGHPVSYQTVYPVGKLPVQPDDFPFLDQVVPIDSLDDVPSH